MGQWLNESICSASPVGQHSSDAILVRLRHQHVNVEDAFPLIRLFRQDVAGMRVTALNLSRGGHAETLRRPFMSFKFRHNDSFQVNFGFAI